MQPIPAIDIAASNGSWLLPALSRSFVALDHEFGAISEGSYVGSTAVVVLIGSHRLWVAHAGDSRAVLGRGGVVQVLTSDHKASRDDEVARVQVCLVQVSASLASGRGRIGVGAKGLIRDLGVRTVAHVLWIVFGLVLAFVTKR